MSRFERLDLQVAKIALRPAKAVLQDGIGLGSAPRADHFGLGQFDSVYYVILGFVAAGAVGLFLQAAGNVSKGTYLLGGDPAPALLGQVVLLLGTIALLSLLLAAPASVFLFLTIKAVNEELARLSTRMVEQHEEERRRLSRELHDETAQVFSAVKIELGLLRDGAAPAVAKRLDRALDLMDTGIRSIRAVTNDLRPSLLDDLGLVPALRSLGSEFSERTRIATDLTISGEAPVLSKDAELALFRALQEALSNVARHAGASAVAIQLARESDAMVLSGTRSRDACAALASAMTAMKKLVPMLDGKPGR